MVEMLFLVWLVPAIISEDIFWFLKQIPAYIRWKERKDAENKLMIAEIEFKENELKKLNKEVELFLKE